MMQIKKSIITAGLVNQNRLLNNHDYHHHRHHRHHRYNLQWQAGLQSSDSVMAPITRTHNVLHTLPGFLCLPSCLVVEPSILVVLVFLASIDNDKQNIKTAVTIPALTSRTSSKCGIISTIVAAEILTQKS